MRRDRCLDVNAGSVVLHPTRRATFVPPTAGHPTAATARNTICAGGSFVRETAQNLVERSGELGTVFRARPEESNM